MALQKSRKRYIAFEIIAEQNFTFRELKDAILKEARKYGLESVLVLPERYNTDKRRGLIKIGHKDALSLREMLENMKEITSKEVKIRTLGTSGTIKTASGKYLQKGLMIHRFKKED